MNCIIIVVEDFQKWLPDHKDTYKDCLVPDLKMAAFKLLTRQKNLHLMKLVASSYEFQSDKEIFLPLLKVSVYKITNEFTMKNNI